MKALYDIITNGCKGIEVQEISVRLLPPKGIALTYKCKIAVRIIKTDEFVEAWGMSETSQSDAENSAYENLYNIITDKKG